MACEVKSFRRQKWGKERRQKEKSLLYSLKKVRIKHLNTFEHKGEGGYSHTICQEE